MRSFSVIRAIVRSDVKLWLPRWEIWGGYGENVQKKYAIRLNYNDMAHAKDCMIVFMGLFF